MVSHSRGKRKPFAWTIICPSEQTRSQLEIAASHADLVQASHADLVQAQYSLESGEVFCGM